MVWWTAPIEAQSALVRLKHAGFLSSSAYDACKQRLRDLLASWREIQPTEQVREQAYAQLERFRLRAGDALHLAAALVWCKQKPRGRLFVCDDERLARAAHEAGFDISGV